jgi:proline dehydrogenase
VLRQIVLRLGRESVVRRLALSTPGVRDLAWRFVAGEDLDAAMSALRGLAHRGILGIINYVGTHARAAPEAVAAADAAVAASNRIRAERLDASLSVKLTQLGLDIDEDLCRRELARVLRAASVDDVFVWIDMEESRYVATTLALFDAARVTFGSERVGIAIQSYLRDRDDLPRLITSGARIRIVKGGYWEPAGTVYRTKAEVDRAFLRDVRRLVEGGVAPAIATHDPAAIAMARRVVGERGLDRRSIEFEMLYGVREDLQDALVRDGFLVRSYVPYGPDWFTYVLGCIRRLPGGLLRRRRRRGPGAAGDGSRHRVDRRPAGRRPGRAIGPRTA